MATVKITALPAITGAVAASTDVIPLVDVSSDVTSKITREELFQNIPSNVTLAAATTEDRFVEVGVGRAGDGNSFIDFVTDATYTGFGARLLRTAGANGTTQINHRGTGPLSFFTQEAAAILFSNNNTERMRINTIGNVGIGSISPANKVTVSAATPYISVFNTTAGSTGTPSYSGLRFYGFTEDANGLAASVDAGNVQASNLGGILRMSTQAAGGGGLVERMRIHATGGVSIGNTTDPGATNLLVTGGIKSNGTQGVGYDTGAGIAVTQLTSRTTATPTTGNKLSGAITLFTAAPALSTWFSFTVPNTAIAATDTVIVSVRSGTNTYVANVTSIVAATSFTISMASIVGTAADAPIVNFSIIRGVSA